MRDVYAVVCPDGEVVTTIYRDTPGLAEKVAEDLAREADQDHAEDGCGRHRIFVSRYWQEVPR